MALKLFTAADKTVAAAATPEAISASATPVIEVCIQALSSNTGKIYVGDDSVSATRCAAELEPGQIWTWEVPAGGRGEEAVLSDIFIQVSVDGEGAHISYVKRR